MRVTIEIDFEGEDHIEMDEELIPELLRLFATKAKITRQSTIVLVGKGKSQVFYFPEVH